MNDSPLLLDYRKGSVNLALYEPLRSLLTPCLECSGEIGKSWSIDLSSQTYYRKDDGKSKTCMTCSDTGRTLSTLSSGDLAFIGEGAQGAVSIGVEIKEITELLSSLISCRLQDTQMRGMLSDYDPGHRWILHYGRYRPSPVDGSIQTWKEGHSTRRAGWYTFKTKTRDRRGNFKEESFPYSRLESFKCCSAKEFGFDFARVETVPEAAHWLTTLYNTWTKPYHTHKSMQVFDKSQDVRSRLRREKSEENLKAGRLIATGRPEENGSSFNRLMDRAAVFNQFPNIGYGRAKVAAEHFSSIRAGVNASVEEWADLQVITEGKSKRAIRLGEEVAKGVVKFVS